MRLWCVNIVFFRKNVIQKKSFKELTILFHDQSIEQHALFNSTINQKMHRFRNDHTKT